MTTTGLVSSDKDLTIDNPTNWADNAVYSLKYFEDSTVPMGGFIVIDIPDGLNFDSNIMTT